MTIKQNKSRRIQILRDSVAKRIAAGEVIDRPLSVVRELLDNSIDSGASEISVHIEGGGIRKIRCIDNGCGMAPEDLELCFLPHSTSKLDRIEDLEKLATLGFRGEALSSISACARLEITSKTEDSECAYRLRINNGNNESLVKSSGQKGTAAEVSDLFYSIPARLQFLKRKSSETAACRSTFIEKTLAFPEISFRLFEDNKLKYFLPASDLNERVTQALDTVFQKEFTYTEEENSDNLSIKAVLSGPSVYHRDRRNIYIYVNRRKIYEYALSQAVEYGYTGYLPGGCYPAACIFLEINPRLVDFNIHPAKREVKFLNIQEIHRLIVRTILKSLQARSRQIESINPEKKDYPEIQHEFQNISNGDRPHSVSFSLKRHLPINEREKFASYAAEAEKSAASEPEISDNTETVYLGQIFGTFLMCMKNGILYFIDQHASHEKILFTKLLEKKSEIQEMLVPLLFSAEKNISAHIEKHLEELSDAGIKLERISQTEWQIISMPLVLHDHSDKVVAFLAEGKLEKERIAQTFYADIACKAAIKDGDVIDDVQAEQLIEQTFQLENPRCPHGRPLWFTLSREELFRFVGRIV